MTQKIDILRIIKEDILRIIGVRENKDFIKLYKKRN